MRGSWQSRLSQSNFTRFFVPINILLLNCQVARKLLMMENYLPNWQILLMQFEILETLLHILLKAKVQVK